MRLCHSDFDRLQRVLLELYEHRDLGSFRAAAPRIFLRLIPADHWALVRYDIDPQKGRAKMSECLESEPRITREASLRWEQLVWEHPFTRYFSAGGEVTALKFSDFFTLEQLKRSKFWEVVCQVLDYDRNISLPVTCGSGTSAFSLGRQRKDFSERDRLLLNLLRPHFNQAYQNAVLVSARSRNTRMLPVKPELLPREQEVAAWLAQGKTNPEIALILQISTRTVEKHVERILEKLMVENRTCAAVMLRNAREGG